MSGAAGIAAMGMACPVGLTAIRAFTAVYAGINRRQFLPYSDDDGTPLVGSALAKLEPHQPRRKRWTWLARQALLDMLGERLAELLPRVPLLVATAEPEVGTPQGVEALRRELSELLGVPLAANGLQVVVGGPTAGLRALASARALLQLQRAEACIVLAADSLIDARTLHALSRKRRLLTERNPDGFTPGEAAACVLLQGPRHGPLGTLSGLGSGREPSTLDNDVPLRAEGLVRAASAALGEAGLALHDMDLRVSDATGESFYFKEQALLPTRLLRQRKREFPLWLTSAELGHVGAAAGLCGVVLALAAFARGRAPGPRAIVLSGTDDGERMAAVLTAPR
jgi:3-oxoacyl-[acyl-carrier-protein] synthase-1